MLTNSRAPRGALPLFATLLLGALLAPALQLAAQDPQAPTAPSMPPPITTPALMPDLGVQQEIRELRASVHALRSEVEAARATGAGASARVRELEQLLTNEQGALLEQEIRTGVARIGGWSQSDKRKLTLGGYFDTEFRIDHAGAQKDTFDQHRLVLQFEADLAGPLSFRSEIEFEGGGFVSGTGNYLSSNQILIEYAETHIAFNDAFNFKVGSLLIPFNRFNYEHDAPLQDLTDRPLVNRRIVPTTWNDAGIGIYGAFHPDFATIDYDIVLVNGFTERINAVDGTRNARASFRRDNNDNKTVAGRIGVSLDVGFLDNLSFGASAMLGKYDDENQKMATMLGLDWRLRKGPFEVLGEYAKLNLERGPGEIGATPPVPGGMDGWYLEARYRFFPESWRGDGLFGQKSSFTLVTRYDSVDSDTAGTAVDFASRGDAYRDDRRRITFGLNFRPTQQTVVKLEYQWLVEPSGIPTVDNDRIVASLATYF